MFLTVLNSHYTEDIPIEKHPTLTLVFLTLIQQSRMKIMLQADTENKIVVFPSATQYHN